jgi:CheY-like chemotaxis protein
LVNDDIDDLAELRVLIVDDSVDAATSLSYLLQMIGCKTAVAFGGEMGVRVAELFQPALMFLDLNMPGHDGCEVLARIKLLPGNVARAMSICLTATGQVDDEQRCLAAGFDQFIQKPLDPHALSDMLRLAHARQTGVTNGWWPAATDASIETPPDTPAPPLPRS